MTQFLRSADETGLHAMTKAGVPQLHRLLLRLAGHLPDELITEARSWLAEDRPGEVVQGLAFGVLAGGAALTPADRQLLSAALEDPDVFADVPVADDDSVPPYTMTAPGLDDGAQDAVDRAAVAAVAGNVPRPAGLWRAWRCPQSPGSAPKRIYLVEVDGDEEALPAITGRIQTALAASGQADPQVEVFDDATALPAYQQLALRGAALLWASAEVPIRFARVFDRVDPAHGPQFDGSRRPVAGPDESAGLLAYLDAGDRLLVTTTRLDDICDRSRRTVVPMDFRTDGEWIWTDAVAYYLREHAVLPDADLVAHIAGRGHRMPRVGAVARHRAAIALQTPLE